MDVATSILQPPPKIEGELARRNYGDSALNLLRAGGGHPPDSANLVHCHRNSVIPRNSQAEAEPLLSGCSSQRLVDLVLPAGSGFLEVFEHISIYAQRDEFFRVRKRRSLGNRLQRLCSGRLECRLGRLARVDRSSCSITRHWNSCAACTGRASLQNIGAIPMFRSYRMIPHRGKDAIVDAIAACAPARADSFFTVGSATFPIMRRWYMVRGYCFMEFGRTLGSRA
jgi:hypothetical protein